MITTSALHLKPSRQRSFTLVELLVVIAIAAILAVLSVSSFAKVIRSTSITSTAQTIVGAFGQARQTAVARNTDVLFCLYQLPDYNSSPSGPLAVYRAYQTFITTSGTTTPLTKIQFLPNLAIISSTATKTTLMNITPTTPVVIGNASFPTNVVLPSFGTNYKAITFQFSPNGGLEPMTAMTNYSWDLTMYLEGDPINAATSIPYDFAVVQIDAFNGAPSVYRP